MTDTPQTTHERWIVWRPDLLAVICAGTEKYAWERFLNIPGMDISVGKAKAQGWRATKIEVME